MSKYEPIVYGWFNEHKFYGDRSNFDIWDIQRTQKKRFAPNDETCGISCKSHTKQFKVGGLYLIYIGGSGTSIIASRTNGRKCYMMELDEHYCDVIFKDGRTSLGRGGVNMIKQLWMG